MKRTMFLAGAVVLSAVCFAGDCFSQGGVQNDTLKTIFSRKSVRSYTGGPVTDEQLTMLVKAGMPAPTAVDALPWDFIVITDKTVLKRLSDALPYAKMAVSAGAAIMVTGDLKRQFGGQDSLYWIMDCSAASENILLAAESMGLGAVWTAVYPDQARVAAVRSILGIPENAMPLNFIPVGIPTGQDKPKDKFDAKRIHKDRW